jgi:hypothetical protein
MVRVDRQRDRQTDRANVEGDGHEIVNVLPQHIRGRTEENHENSRDRRHPEQDSKVDSQNTRTNGDVRYFHFGESRFESRPDYSIHQLRFLVVYLSHSIKIMGYYFQLDHYLLLSTNISPFLLDVI